MHLKVMSLEKDLALLFSRASSKMVSVEGGLRYDKLHRDWTGPTEWWIKICGSNHHEYVQRRGGERCNSEYVRVCKTQWRLFHKLESIIWGNFAYAKMFQKSKKIILSSFSEATPACDSLTHKQCIFMNMTMTVYLTLMQVYTDPLMQSCIK